MPRGAIDSYKTEPRVVLDREELECAVFNMGKIAGLRLIRASYKASLAEAKLIRAEMLDKRSRSVLGIDALTGTIPAAWGTPRTAPAPK